MKLQRIFTVAMLIVSLGRDATAQTTATTTPVGYLNVQGVLQENGAPVNGFMDFCWWIYATPLGGNALAHHTNMNNSVLVSNGVANVTLNVGNLAELGLSPTQELYLELDVRRSGTTNEFTILSPRQRIVPAMFATSAARAEEARRLIEPLSPELIPSVVPSLTFTGRPVFAATSGPPFAVGSSAMVAGLTAEAAAAASYADDADKLDGLDSSAFWQLLGNAGTTAGLNFLGTTDDQPLELKVNSARALRLEPNTIAPNIIAGSAANAVTGTEGASIGGGHLNTINANAFFSVIGGGAENVIDMNAENSTVSGGQRNSIQANATRSTIGGGATNNIQTFADFATIGGGVNNNIFPDTDWATISGGRTNVILNGAAESTIGGGGYHYIGNGSEAATISGGYSNTLTKAETTIGGGVKNSIHSGQGTIGGGYQNTIQTDANYSTISGGDFNLINQSSLGATIGGGVSNKVDQGAPYGTIAGGYGNTVGRASAAIGGGEQNAIAAIGATIAGGIANQIHLDAKASTIGGGAGQIIEHNVTNGVIAGGFGNVIHSNANYSAISGGRENHVGSSAPFASIPGGREAKAFNYGQMAHASGGFASQEGTAQGSAYVLRGVTGPNQNTGELFLDEITQRINVPNNSTWTYDVLIVGRSASGASVGLQVSGLIQNNGGTTALAGTQRIQSFAISALIGGVVEADDTRDALVVKVHTNLTSTDWRWVATVRTAEVVF